MSAHHDHDDFGGLHRDLLAAGAVMDRRSLFRMAGRFGGAVGTFQLLGCSNSTTAPTTTATTTTTTTPTSGSACSVIPNETQGPYPGDGSNATSQIALPKATNDLVYATAGYEASVSNMAQVSLATDNVFSDGASLELATISGSVAGGLTATLSVAV